MKQLFVKTLDTSIDVRNSFLDGNATGCKNSLLTFVTIERKKT